MSGLLVGVDVGGTFTDFVVVAEDPFDVFLWKRPSFPAEPDRAILDGLAEALAEYRLAAGAVRRFAHGTTVGTNALIQRTCGRVAVVTTDGFRDLLEIGRQTRPRIYDVHLDHPPPLVPREQRYEVRERRLADGTTWRALAEGDVDAVADALSRAPVDCVAVCFLHSHAFPEHEQRAAERLRTRLGDAVEVICSSTVYPEFREYERFSTTVLNGALLTVMRAYLTRLGAGVRKLGVTADTLVSQSAGGLLSLADARDLPVRTALSGPAAGVVGAAHRAAAAGYPDIITIDVGGTSTDVSLVSGGRPARVASRALAGFPLRLPTLDVNAVGAGGGSIAWIDKDGLLKVGPQSAGAEPGPLCYARGGTAVTVTDANVVLGRLPADALLGGRMPIDASLARAGIARLAAELRLSMEETALGVVQVATANMVRAIRTISVERGHRPADFALFAFGGAGPLHASDVAREMDMRTIVVPPRPGLLCAEGLMFADLARDFVHSLVTRLSPETQAALGRAREKLLDQAETWFKAERVPPSARERRWTAELRYVGQNFELAVALPDAPFDAGAIRAIEDDFQRLHEQSYGYAFADEPLELVNLKLTAVGLLPHPPIAELPPRPPGRPVSERRAIFRSVTPVTAPVFRRDDLARDQTIAGPAIVEQVDTTTVIFPGEQAHVDRFGNLIVTVEG